MDESNSAGLASACVCSECFRFLIRLKFFFSIVWRNLKAIWARSSGNLDGHCHSALFGGLTSLGFKASVTRSSHDPSSFNAFFYSPRFNRENWQHRVKYFPFIARTTIENHLKRKAEDDDERYEECVVLEQKAVFTSIFVVTCYGRAKKKNRQRVGARWERAGNHHRS